MSKKRLGLILFLLFIVAGTVAIYVYRNMRSDSNDYIARWLNDPAGNPEMATAYDEPCPGAPFLLPSSGLIGLLWRDPGNPYNLFRRHSGIDIFGADAPGTVPIVAAYDGYLTRLDDWKSTVIIRHDDPLEPGRTIWTYYTHMADVTGEESFIVDDFPPGTEEQFVEQGTLLGYQGEYSGTGPAVALHLHFSIVTSEADGSFKNEAVLGNTLDPSAYLGLSVKFDDGPDRPIRCVQVG